MKRTVLLIACAALLLIPVGVVGASYISKVYMADNGDSQYLVLGGKADYTGGGARYDYVAAISTTAELTTAAYPSGGWYRVTAADVQVTLPTSAEGIVYTFMLTNDALSTGTGFRVAPQAADAIHGNGLTSVDGAYLVCAGSGDREGDCVSLVGDGLDGWYITNAVGTWTKE